MSQLIKPVCIIGVVCGLLGGALCAFAQTGLTENEQTHTLPYRENGLAEKTQNVAKAVEQYLLAHPEKTVDELQRDPHFQRVAVQRIGSTGYTAIIDADEGTFYFHPQGHLVGKTPRTVQEDLPDFWKVATGIIEGRKKESFGCYAWQAPDGLLTETHMYLYTSDVRTGEGRRFCVAGINYLDPIDAAKDISEYDVTPPFLHTKAAVQEKAADVVRQIEKYIKEHPDKSIADLQADAVFQGIAVQPVGKTGHTSVVDYESLVYSFHYDENYVNHSLEDYAKQHPGLWKIFKQSHGGVPADGVYDYHNPDGSVKKKYMATAMIQARSADSAHLYVAATADLDDSDLAQETNDTIVDTESAREKTQFDSFVTSPLLFIGSIAFCVISLLCAIQFKFMFLERKKIIALMIIFMLLVSALFVYMTWRSIRQMREAIQLQKIEHTHFLLEAKSEMIKKQLIFFINALTELSHNVAGHEYADEIITSHLRHSFLANKAFTHACYRIGVTGRIENMYPIDKNALGADISYQEHIQEVSQRHTPVVSNIFMAVEGFPAITVHVPVFKGTQYDGTVAYLINLNTIREIFFADTDDLFSALYLIDTHQKVIFSRTPEDRNQAIDAVATFDEEAIVLSHTIDIANQQWKVINVEKREFLAANVNSYVMYQWRLMALLLTVIVCVAVIMNVFLTRSLAEEINRKTHALARATDEAKRMADQADRANHAKSTFLAKISHELRTPLNSIVGFSEASQRSFSLPEIQKNITNVLGQSELLLSLLNTLLDHAQIETGKLVLTPEPVSVRTLLTELEILYKAKARAKGLSFVISCMDDVPEYICVDSLRLKQVLGNFVMNSIKFTKEGTVSIFIECLNLYDDTRAQLRFSVIDTGIGIELDRQRDIFESFTQEDNSLSREYGGSGLGITIAKDLLHLMGGELGLESVPGEGSTFWFNLDVPICDAQQLQVVEDAGTDGVVVPTQKKRILLAEDYKPNQEVVVLHAQSAGYDIAIAENGQEAVAACEKNTFDLILMDLQMPHMDGCEATKVIRKMNEHYKSIPIVAITANADEASRCNALNAGMTDVLTKPIRRAVLLKKIQEVLT